MHHQLSTLAFNQKKSLSEVINSKLKNANYGSLKSNVSTKQGLALFAKLGKKAGKTDWTKLVREERDRL